MNKRFSLLLVVFLVLLYFVHAALCAPFLLHPKFLAFVINGDPLSGGQVFTNNPDTTTKKSSYLDNALSVANANPIIWDSKGDVSGYLDGSTKTVFSPSTVTAPPTSPIRTNEIVESVNSPQLGYYVSEYDGLANAISDIGTTVTILHIDKDCILSDGETVTIPSTLTLVGVPGYTIDGTAGGSTETLTIAGGIEAGPYQIFGSSVTVAVDDSDGCLIEKWYPQWWGAVGDNSTDNTKAINAALNAIGTSSGYGTYYGTLYFPPGIYLTSDELLPSSRTKIIGAGSTSTYIYRTTNTGPIIRYTTGLSFMDGCDLKGVFLSYSTMPADRYNYTSAYAIHIDGDMYNHIWSDVIVDSAYYGLYRTSSWFNCEVDMNANRCYTGYYFDTGYTTSCTGNMNASRCFHGHYLRGFYYSSISVFHDFCGLVVSDYGPTDEVPILLNIFETYNLNMPWWGIENSDAMFFYGSYGHVTVNSPKLKYMVGKEWSYDAARTDNLVAAKQAVLSLDNWMMLELNSPHFRMEPSGSYSTASSLQTDLIYISDTGGYLALTGNPSIYAHNYYWGRRDNWFHFVEYTGSAPGQWSYCKRLYVSATGEYSGMSETTESDVSTWLYGKNTEVIPIDIRTVTTVISLPEDMPTGTKIRVTKDNTEGTTTISLLGSDALGDGTVSTASLGYNGANWTFAKTQTNRWDIIEGWNRGSNLQGDWIQRADGIAEYTRNDLSISGSGTSITSTGISHPITFIAEPTMVLNLNSLTAGEEAKVSMYRAYSVEDATYAVGIYAEAGSSFVALTEAVFDVYCRGRWY